MSYLQNINRLSKANNLGGVLIIQLVRKADVLTITDPVDGVVYGDIELKPGKQFVTWQVILESPRTKSQSKNSPEGNSRTNGLNFLIPKDRPEIKNQLDQAEADEFIVVFTDGNATQKIFGLLDTPVRFEYDHDSGAAFSTLNAYDCRFYYEGPNNLYHYNGAIPTSPPGSAPAIVYWNGSPIASLAPGDSMHISSEFGYTEFFITT